MIHFRYIVILQTRKCKFISNNVLLAQKLVSHFSIIALYTKVMLALLHFFRPTYVTFRVENPNGTFCEISNTYANSVH